MTTKYFHNGALNPRDANLLVTSSEQKPFVIIHSNGYHQQNLTRWINDFNQFVRTIEEMGWVPITKCRFKRMIKDRQEVPR